MPPRAVTLAALLFLSAVSFGGDTSRDLISVTRGLRDVLPPPQGETQWIAKSMRLNGLPMTLKSFRSRLTPDALCHHYQATMSSTSGAETFLVRRGEWTLLTIKSPRDLVTIQARSTSSGSEGTIAVSPPLDGVRLQITTAFPRPVTASIVNLQAYDDAGIEAEHISMTSPRGIAVEAHAFAQKILQDGWQIIRLQPTRHSPGGQVIEAQKGAQHALLTLMRHRAQPDATAIVVVWRKS